MSNCACAVPKFGGRDQLILASLGIRKLHFQPGVENDAGHIPRRLNGVREEEQSGQGWHSKTNLHIQFNSFITEGREVKIEIQDF